MAISADLGGQLEAFVTQLVESGRYNSKTEVLQEGVRIIQDSERRLADTESGRVVGVGVVFDRFEAKYAKMAAKN